MSEEEKEKFTKLQELQEKQGNLNELEVPKGFKLQQRLGLKFQQKYGEVSLSEE